MAFNWTNYLKLAEGLKDEALAGAVDEAKLRCAISRSYYAAFCTAADFLRQEHWRSPDSGGSHQNLIDEFKLANDATRATIGEQLEDMIYWRVQADYRKNYCTDQTKTKNDIKQMCTHAKAAVAQSAQIIEMISKLTPDTRYRR